MACARCPSARAGSSFAARSSENRRHYGPAEGWRRELGDRLLQLEGGAHRSPQCQASDVISCALPDRKIRSTTSLRHAAERDKRKDDTACDLRLIASSTNSSSSMPSSHARSRPSTRVRSLMSHVRSEAIFALEPLADLLNSRYVARLIIEIMLGDQNFQQRRGDETGNAPDRADRQLGAQHQGLCHASNIAGLLERRGRASRI